MKKAKERYSKEKVAAYYFKTKKQQKKSQESVIKILHKKKKTRLRSTKGKVSRTGSV